MTAWNQVRRRRSASRRSAMLERVQCRRYRNAIASATIGWSAAMSRKLIVEFTDDSSQVKAMTFRDHARMMVGAEELVKRALARVLWASMSSNLVQGMGSIRAPTER